MYHKKIRAWVECFIPIILLIMSAGIPDSFGAAAKGGTEASKLPSSYDSADSLYAALAKLPFDKRQEAILAGARKEGKVVIYTSESEDTIEPALRDFERRYPGVKTEPMRALADELVLKALTEVRAGRWYWDTLSLGGAYDDLKKANALAKHHRLFPPGNYPKSFMGEDWFGTQIMPLFIAYNTNMVKANEAPKSYKDLLDPKWKGKVSIDVNPENLIAGMIKKWGRVKTEDWVDKFVNVNKALLRKGHTAQTKLLVAGEFPVSAELYADRLEYVIQNDKAPVDWLIPEDLCQADLSLIAISRKAPRPYAALLWAQYYISNEGQSLLAKTGNIPVHPDATLPYPRLKKVMANPDRLTVTNSAVDKNHYAEANDLIKKQILPRLREGQ